MKNTIRIVCQAVAETYCGKSYNYITGVWGDEIVFRDSRFILLSNGVFVMSGDICRLHAHGCNGDKRDKRLDYVVEVR